MWTHVEILVELILVRVHTGWFISLLSPPRFMALIRVSIGQLLSLLYYGFTLIPERVLLFLEFNTIDLQTTRSTTVWGKQRYSPCYWTKKNKTLFFYFCFQDFVAKFAAIVDSCRSYFSQAGLTARVNCKLSSLIADFNLHNALSNQWRDHFLCQWKKGWYFV